MNHPTAEQLLPSLPDGLLPAATEAAVRAHVAECPPCQRSLGELEAIDALLRRLPASVLPRRPTPGGDARLEALARWAPSALRGGRVRGAWPAAPTPFVAGVVLALGLLLGLRPDPARQAAPGRVADAEGPRAAAPEVVLASTETGDGHRPAHRSRPGPAPSTSGPEIYYLPVGLR